MAKSIRTINKLSNEEKAKYYLFNTNKNIFLTGPAGVGKTTLIKEFIENNSNVIICAPTGVAAINAGGETMHQVCSIPIPAYGGNLNNITKAKIKNLLSCKCIIIDEISMARNDIFSFAIKVIKKAERLKKKENPNEDNHIRVIVVGDFRQLPPVVQKKEIKLLQKYGYDPSGFAFTTKEWQQLNFITIELDEIKRQNDIEFINNLWLARNSDSNCLSYFNQFISKKEDFDAIRLCGTNAEAERLNREYLDSLPGISIAYQAEKKGRTQNSNIDNIVLLKEGAKVYFTVNDNVHNLYANGTFGTILTCDPKYVDVDVNGKIIRVFPHISHCYSYNTINNIITKKEIGSIKQIPLRIAKAITIHKSQGKTFDKAIITPEIFAPGQLYVALSRVKSPDGLFLTSPILPSALKGNDIVDSFYQNNFNAIIYDKKSPSKKEKSISKKTSSNTKSTKLKKKKAITPLKNTVSKKSKTKTTKVIKKTTSKNKTILLNKNTSKLSSKTKKNNLKSNNKKKIKRGK